MTVSPAPNTKSTVSSHYSYTYSNTSSNTVTRYVPRSCDVCRGKGKRRAWKELDNKFVKDGFVTCDACEGAGWRYIMETENLPYPYPVTVGDIPLYNPYAAPYISYQNGSDTFGVSSLDTFTRDI